MKHYAEGFIIKLEINLNRKYFTATGKVAALWKSELNWVLISLKSENHTLFSDIIFSIICDLMVCSLKQESI